MNVMQERIIQMVSVSGLTTTKMVHLLTQVKLYLLKLQQQRVQELSRVHSSFHLLP